VALSRLGTKAQSLVGDMRLTHGGNRTMRARAWQTATALAFGAVLMAAPVSASAAVIYPPTGSCSTTPAAVAPGEVVRFSCESATFSSNETVTITVTGENGAASRVGMVRFGIGTASGTSQSSTDGSLSTVEIALPSDASGTYNIAAISPTSVGGTAAVTIANPAGNLPVTGLTNGATLGIVVGGGALVAAGLALGSAALIRHRQNAD